MIDFKTARNMIDSFTPISRFNKGEAGKIVEEVKRDGIRIIVKNNEPECVLLSMESFSHLVENAERNQDAQKDVSI